MRSTSIRTDMRPHFDPRQRQQIVDQPRHARRLLSHDAEETLARLGIVFGRALQRIDEAGQRRSGVRNSWLALATKSARIWLMRSISVRSRSNENIGGAPPSPLLKGATIAAMQQPTGARSA